MTLARQQPRGYSIPSFEALGREKRNMSEIQNKAVALATQIEGQLVNRLGMLTPYWSAPLGVDGPG
jgi:hypothetical protein